MDKQFVDDFTYHVARVGKQWGLGEPCGRIWGIILINSKPLSQKEIAKQTDYSLGLVSPSLKLLERIGMVSVAGTKGKEKLYKPVTSLVDSFEKLMKNFNDIEITPVASLISENIEKVQDEEVKSRLTNLLKDYERMANLLGLFSKLMLTKLNIDKLKERILG